MDLSFGLMLVAAFVAGAINAVAGGGTLFTFTALGLVMDLRHANATNSALLTPASFSSAIAFRQELALHWRRFVILAVPSLAGAWTGALGFVHTDNELFKRVVPFLILFAVLLFAFKDQFAAVVRRMLAAPTVTADRDHIALSSWIAGSAFQFIVACYGGYFGAGIGILMIASFHLMGMRDLHVMNALKNPLACLMNGTATACFIFKGLIDWQYAIPMSVCAVLGGYSAALASRRINQKYLRWFVIGYGLVISVFLFVRYWL